MESALNGDNGRRGGMEMEIKPFVVPVLVSGPIEYGSDANANQTKTAYFCSSQSNNAQGNVIIVVIIHAFCN